MARCEIFKGGMRITQVFGNRHPFFKGAFHRDFYKRYNCDFGHNGFDAVPNVPENKEIYAPYGGTISYVAPTCNDGYGFYVRIKTVYQGKEYLLYFCHLHSVNLALRIGQKIEAGTLLGVMGGSSGGKLVAYSPHLHFGVRRIGVSKNNGYNGYIDPYYIGLTGTKGIGPNDKLNSLVYLQSLRSKK